MRLDHLVRLISQQWAIHPEVLENWCQILDAKLAGHELPKDLAAAGSGRSRADEEPFIRHGNVAIVPVEGTLVKANTLFSCDATYGEIRRAIAAAEQARGIDAILVHGDTPGGTVAGAQETGDFIRRVDQRKPVYGWVDDLAASAGYWLLSQARMIGANSTADVGSIGVLTVHYDRSVRDQQFGVRRTVLAVGDYKAAGNDTAPLPEEARQYLMERLNQTYDLFIAAVTSGRRSLAADEVRAMQSRVYKAAQAKSLGLIDHVMGRDEYIELIKRQIKGAVSAHITRGAKAMDLTELKANHPDLVARIEADARQGLIAQADHDTAVAAARQGVLDLHAAVFGEEIGQRFAAVVNSGVTAGQAQALGVSLAAPAGSEQADLASRQAILAGLQAAAPAPVAGVKPEGGPAAERSALAKAIAAGGSAH